MNLFRDYERRETKTAWFDQSDTAVFLALVKGAVKVLGLPVEVRGGKACFEAGLDEMHAGVRREEGRFGGLFHRGRNDVEQVLARMLVRVWTTRFV